MIQRDFISPDQLESARKELIVDVERSIYEIIAGLNEKPLRSFRPLSFLGKITERVSLKVIDLHLCKRILISSTIVLPPRSEVEDIGPTLPSEAGDRFFT